MSDRRTRARYTLTGAAAALGLGSLLAWGPFTTPDGEYWADATLGNRPNVAYASWRLWANGYVRSKFVSVPLERGTTYYVDATDGSDSNDGLSTGAAFQTVSKVNTVMTASSGNVRFRFQRGETWRQTSASLVVNKSNVTLDAYGTGAPPVITRFAADYGSAGWTNDVTFTNCWTRTDASAGTLAWVKSKGLTHDRPYQKMDSATNCNNTDGSFFISGTTVYVNPHGSPSLSGSNERVEPVYDNSVLGIEVASGTDNVRIEGLYVEGFGCTASTTPNATYGIKCNNDGTVLVVDCQSYYGGNHNIGMTATSAGVLMAVRCKAGWVAQPDTPFVGYATNGGHVYWLEDCEAVGGELPRNVQPYVYGGGVVASQTHTNGSGSNYVALSVVRRLKVRQGPFMANGLHNDQHAEDCRNDVSLADCFIVDSEFDPRTESARDAGATKPGTNAAGYLPSTFYGGGWGSSPIQTVYVNCKLTARPAWDTSPNGNRDCLSQIRGMYLNCTLVADASQIPTPDSNQQRFRSFHTNSTTNAQWKAYNCHFHVKVPYTVGAAIDGECATSNNDAKKVPNVVLMNSIVTADWGKGTGVFKLGLNNQAAQINNNAYGCADGKTDTYAGYDQDPNLVEIANHAPGSRPYTGSTLLATSSQVQTLPGGYRLEYDATWTKRSVSSSARGPLEAFQ